MRNEKVYADFAILTRDFVIDEYRKMKNDIYGEANEETYMIKRENKEKNDRYICWNKAGICWIGMKVKRMTYTCENKEGVSAGCG